MIFLQQDNNRHVAYIRENANNRPLDPKESMEWAKENNLL